MDIALVDDRQEDLDRLSSILTEYAAVSGQQMNLHKFHGGEALLDGYRPHSYAVIFLDIYMNGITGVETARRIRMADDDVCLVFLTSSDEHQAEAIHYHVYDYLSKDAGHDAVFRVLDRILRRHTDVVGTRLDFQADKTNVSLRHDDLVYLTADRNYLVVHDCRKKEYRTRMTFSSARSALEKDSRFIQILRGVIVNMDYIQDISGNTCCLQGGIHLPVSIRNRSQIDRLWTNYNFAKIRRESLEGGSL